MSFKQDTARLQKIANTAFCQTGVLAALADGRQADPDKIQRALEVTAGQFESAALEVRKLCEKYSPGTGGYGNRPVLAPMEIAGTVEVLGYGWLHITLNTLLPHCRYQPPEWLSDTIRRLLDEYEGGGSKLPFFNRALLVIDEHTLALALLSGESELDICHITLLDRTDAADFFAFRSGDYQRQDFYSGGWC